MSNDLPQPTIDSELTELEDLILRIVGAANDRGISKKNIGDMVNLIAQEANKAKQQLITELLGELPKPKKIEIYNAYNQPDDPFPMGFNAAIGETVSVIERYREGL